MPRTKSDEERGYIAAWMRRERTRLGWSPEQVVEALADDGTRIRADYYRQLEAGTGGKRPGPELLIALVKLFRSEPEPFPEPPAPELDSDLAALIASNERLAAATAAFTEAVDSQTQKLDRVWDRLGDLIERLDRQHPLTKEDAMAMSEGLADGIGAALAGSISDLAAALRQPAPAKPGGRG